MTTLSEVFPTRRGGYWGVEPGTSDTDMRAIRNGDVGTTGEVRWSSLPVRGYKSREAERARVTAGDIVLTTSGNCGNASFIATEPEFPTVATNFVRVLRTAPGLADPRFAFHFLRSDAFARGISPFVRGATIKNLSVEAAFESIDMPTPPLKEQRRFAAILDAADAIRVKRRALLTRLDSLTQSAFHQMFGRARATGVVGEVFSAIRTGPFGSDLLHSEFVDQGVAVLGLDNVVGNEFRWAGRRFISQAKYEQLRRYTVSPGDVLISIMGTVGRCVVVPDGIPTAINTKHICAITVDRSRVDPAFLRAAFLWHPASRAHVRQQSKGAIMDGLNMGIIKSIPIPIPSLNDQRIFAARAAAIYGERTRIQRALAADDELFASLQAQAFEGRL